MIDLSKRNRSITQCEKIHKNHIAHVAKDDQRSTEELLAWRVETAEQLRKHHLFEDAYKFWNCGAFIGNFSVFTCSEDQQHGAKALPMRCHLRYCPECERRESLRKVEKYFPVLRKWADDDAFPKHTLKHLVLTTSYDLRSPQARTERKQATKDVDATIRLFLWRHYEDELTPAEKKDGQINYRKRGIGVMISEEYGENGHKLHFHITLYCPYISQKFISECWRHVTGGKCRVTYIKQIGYGDIEGALKEQVKYVTKFTKIPPKLVPALARTLKGVRRFRAQGVFYGKLSEADKALYGVVERVPAKCIVCEAKKIILPVENYFLSAFLNNQTPDALIVALAPEQAAQAHERAVRFSSVQKHYRDKFPQHSETQSKPTARSDPNAPQEQLIMPLGAVESLKPTPYRYE